MPGFELEFGVEAEDVDGTLVRTPSHKRVISAEDNRRGFGPSPREKAKLHEEFARQIARAMLGEAIDASEKLAEFISCEFSNNKPFASYWNEVKTWSDVKKILESEIHGIVLEFVRGENGKIVGLRRVE